MQQQFVALLVGLLAAAAALSGVLIKGVLDSRLMRVQLQQQAAVAELQASTQLDISRAQGDRQLELFEAQRLEERIARLAEEKQALYSRFLVGARTLEQARWWWTHYERELERMGYSIFPGLLYPGTMPEAEGPGVYEVRPTLTVLKGETYVDRESVLGGGSPSDQPETIQESHQKWVDQARRRYKSFVFEREQLQEVRAAMDLLVPQEVRAATRAIVQAGSEESLEGPIHTFISAARRDLSVDEQ